MSNDDSANVAYPTRTPNDRNTTSYTSTATRRPQPCERTLAVPFQAIQHHGHPFPVEYNYSKPYIRPYRPGPYWIPPGAYRRSGPNWIPGGGFSSWQQEEQYQHHSGCGYEARGIHPVPSVTSWSELGYERNVCSREPAQPQPPQPRYFKFDEFENDSQSEHNNARPSTPSTSLGLPLPPPPARAFGPPKHTSTAFTVGRSSHTDEESFTGYQSFLPSSVTSPPSGWEASQVARSTTYGADVKYEPVPLSSIQQNHDLPSSPRGSLRPLDIVCGRGAPTNFHYGNQVFREVVGEYQTKYLCAKRSDKPHIAMKILDVVKDSGARFVRREKTCGNLFIWVQIDDKGAYEKVCQALRDGAPDLRRQVLLSSPSPPPSDTKKKHVNDTFPTQNYAKEEKENSSSKH